MNGDTTTSPIGPGIINPEVIKASRGWFIALGIILVILGTAAVIMPVVFTFAVEIMIGWLLLAGGVFQIVHAFQARQWKGSLLYSLAAIIYLIAGGMLLAYPLKGALTLTVFLAAFFVVEGIFKIIWSIQLKSHGKWGWVLFSGLVALALGILIYNNLPSSAAWAIGLLVGIDMIFGGWTLIMLSSALKKTT